MQLSGISRAVGRLAVVARGLLHHCAPRQKVLVRRFAKSRRKSLQSLKLRAIVYWRRVGGACRLFGQGVLSCALKLWAWLAWWPRIQPGSSASYGCLASPGIAYLVCPIPTKPAPRFLIRLSHRFRKPSLTITRRRCCRRRKVLAAPRLVLTSRFERRRRCFIQMATPPSDQRFPHAGQVWP